MKFRMIISLLAGLLFKSFGYYCTMAYMSLSVSFYLVRFKFESRSIFWKVYLFMDTQKMNCFLMPIGDLLISTSVVLICSVSAILKNTYTKGEVYLQGSRSD